MRVCVASYHLSILLPLVPWSELAKSKEEISPTGKALSWVLENQGVCTALVAVASVAELEAVLEGMYRRPLLSDYKIVE